MEDTSHDSSVFAGELHSAASEGIAANVHRWLRFIGWRPGTPIELQALDVPRNGRTVNRFAHATDEATIVNLLVEADQWKAPGGYFVLNRIDPAVATRAKAGRWHDAKKGSSTSDRDITHRCAIYIDVDARRPAGTSATQEQIEAAIAVAAAIYRRLADVVGGAALAAGLSGNGAAIFVALDAVAESTELAANVKGILAALQLLHETADVKVDTSVAEAKRLCPAWGTYKRKGAAGIAERPHRATGIAVPAQVRRLTANDLEALLETLISVLSPEQRAVVDKAMGRRTELPARSVPKDGAIPFRVANDVGVSDVLGRLGLLNGDDVKCPGCGTVGHGGDTSVAIVGNGVKCLHARCASKGQSGFYNVVDIVCEVEHLQPIEAVRQLGHWFGFPVPEEHRKIVNLATVAGRGGFVGSVGTDPGVFPDPQPLGYALPPVAPLEIDLVPEPFRGWIGDIAHRLQTPPDMAAIAAIVSLASVIGRAVAIRPKARDDWDEVPNLWGGVVADPGGYKTPNLKAGMQPLNRLVGMALAEHRCHQEEVKSNEVVNEAEIKALKKRIQKAVESASGKGRGHLRIVEDDDSLKPVAAQDDPKELAEQLAELERAGYSPRLRRYVVNDPSVEKLGELLKENDRGLLLFRDELPGFLYKLEEEGHESDRAFYLEAWNGNGQPFTYDRIVRGSVRIESPCISILGGAQPGPLTRYIRSALKSDSGDDGLIQRFQLLIWPDTLKAFKYVDEWPNSEAKDRAFAIFKKVSEPGLAAAIGAVGDPTDSEKVHHLRFDPRSQELFESWYQKLMVGVRSGEDHPAICSHRVKYSSTMPALALLFHAIAVADSTASAGPVSVGATTLAIRWIDYLEVHARRLYSAFTRRREIAGALLGAKIQAGKVSSPFRVRGDVLLKGWAGLTELDDVNLAIEELVEAGWIRQRGIPSTQQGGRPTVEYLINPKVQACRAPRVPGEDDA